MRRIKLSDDAFYDIEEMFSYISKDNKQAAAKLRKRLYDAIKKLNESPFIGAMITEDDAPGAERGYRYIVVNPYLAFYRVLDDRIIIARVLHSRQNWLQILFGYQEESM